MIYLKLFYIFFKVGILGFGGGYAILPMIYQEILIFDVITADDFSNLVALSQVTPGPIAINAATYVGFKAAGTLGAIIATTAVSLPSLLLIILVVHFMNKFKGSKLIQNLLKGIRPATVGLIGAAFIFLGKTAFMDEHLKIDYHSFSSILSGIKPEAIVIFIIVFLMIRLTKLGAIPLTLMGAALGVVVGLIV